MNSRTHIGAQAQRSQRPHALRPGTREGTSPNFERLADARAPVGPRAGPKQNEVAETAEPAYSKKSSPTGTVQRAARILMILPKFDSWPTPYFNTLHVKLDWHPQANNGVMFRPRKNGSRREPDFCQAPEFQERGLGTDKPPTGRSTVKNPPSPEPGWRSGPASRAAFTSAFGHNQPYGLSPNCPNHASSALPGGTGLPSFVAHA